MSEETAKSAYRNDKTKNGAQSESRSVEDDEARLVQHQSAHEVVDIVAADDDFLVLRIKG